MRPLEILLAITVFLAWLPAPNSNTRIWRLLPICIAVLFVLHIIVDLPRWQMIPIYAALGMQWLSTLLKIKTGSSLMGVSRLRAKCLILMRAFLNLSIIACSLVGVIL